MALLSEHSVLVECFDEDPWLPCHENKLELFDPQPRKIYIQDSSDFFLTTFNYIRSYFKYTRPAIQLKK